jgi:hypothetical protein
MVELTQILQNGVFCLESSSSRIVTSNTRV